jgi:hypothetical protein
MKERDPYNIENWYWIVAADPNRAYSSAVGNYVSIDDTTYQAWRDRGNQPTRINSEHELGEVLTRAKVRPVPPGILSGYRATYTDAIFDIGTINILFDHENRILALEKLSPITMEEFKIKVRSLM